VNRGIEAERLRLRKVALAQGEDSDAYRKAVSEHDVRVAQLKSTYEELAANARAVKEVDEGFRITLAEVGGRQKTIRLSEVVRMYPANALRLGDKIGIYFSRWAEFLTHEPREANTEGGVMPAIFGTFAMTILLAVAVAPFGVMAALYLREYAKQGRLVSIVRISVNNLAGVPSIVYGVFGLGFFAYLLGGTIDSVFFPERLPAPTFGTGGLLWASLTLALLTVPVVIVATEVALAAGPPSMREGSLACGASKWQTIKYIVLPRAMPGIMTGLILAMARGAGEVAPLMIVGVVKLAPELPVDGVFPFVHLERSFMHLGFHIFDVGFQSRNAEAGKPMVYVTTLLLITLVALMNASAIKIRNRLKKKFFAGHF
jgi:phosphate transport system permease protein